MSILARRESATERKCCTYALNQGWITIKLTTRGWPDRLFMGPGGAAFMVEFKSERGKLRPLQEHWKKKLTSLGIDVNVINSFEAFKLVLSAYTQ